MASTPCKKPRSADRFDSTLRGNLAESALELLKPLFKRVDKLKLNFERKSDHQTINGFLECFAVSFSLRLLVNS